MNFKTHSLHHPIARLYLAGFGDVYIFCGVGQSAGGCADRGAIPRDCFHRYWRFGPR
jgi:hypothetical protein